MDLLDQVNDPYKFSMNKTSLGGQQPQELGWRLELLEKALERGRFSMRPFEGSDSG